MKETSGFIHESRVLQSDDWITPPHIKEIIGPCDLDPCASNHQPWSFATCEYRLLRGEDGLLLPWSGLVYCNPPYSNVESWFDKMKDHMNEFLLIFARIDTKLWQNKIWPTADNVLFLKGRLRFHFPDGTPAHNSCGAPSAIVGFGQVASERLYAAAPKYGVTVINAHKM